MNKNLLIFSIIGIFLSGCSLLSSSTQSEPETSPQTTNNTPETMMAPADATVYKVDTTASTLEWTGRMGPNSHSGTVDISSGEIWLSQDGSISGMFTVDMTSITNEETFEVNGHTVVEHLKSEDFFEVETYPTATFNLTAAEPTESEVGADGSYEVSGDLTMKGVTAPINFIATLSQTENTATITSDMTIDRSTWNVRYGSASFFDDLGDKVISDQIELNLSLVAEKQ